ncbi:MAG TPA: hypothetical protein PK530_13015 [Anaerolineales bacterium]|nr:hypothetical protein [Anaerolineales bacterium]
MKKKSQLFPLLFLILWILVGCTPNPSPVVPGITIIAPTPTVEESAYPAPFEAYPGPAGGQSVPPVTKVVPTAIAPTQNATLAVVKGRLLLLDQPLGGFVLYLAPVITGESGGRMVRFERTTSIRTATDADGFFTFVNVPPGEYGIVYDKVIEPYLLLNPDGETLTIPIAGNEQIDLGELNYDDLPIPPQP